MDFSQYKILIIVFIMFPLISCNDKSNKSTDDSLSNQDNSIVPSKVVQHTISVNGIMRSYSIHIPTGGLQPNSSVVMIFHGGGGNAEDAMNITQFNSLSEKYKFLAVYPNGTGTGLSGFTWNVIHCCAFARKNSSDDLSFFDSLIDHLQETYSINTKKIFITGMSNGGMIAQRIARERSNKVAGMSSVVSNLFGTEASSVNPVPTLLINGELDDVLPFEGGSSTKPLVTLSTDGTPFESADYAFESYWKSNNVCTGEIITNISVNVTKYSGDGCTKKTEYYIVHDNGHAWPGGKPGSGLEADAPSNSLDASEVIWNFFDSL